MTRVDLEGAEVIDAHCHPYRLPELLERDPMTLETRCMFLGTALLSSTQADKGLATFVDELTESTVFGLALRRWLAGYLGCEPTKEAVAKTRDELFRSDPVGYTKALLADQHVTAVLADEGYPQPTIPRDEFEAALGISVHRVARIEPWVVQHRDGSFDDLVAGFEAEVKDAGADPRFVAYKTIIAYRTGLDVEKPAVDEARSAFDRWRADGWRESREHAKPVRDFLLRLALQVAKEEDRVFHIHCGGGDPDIDLAHAKPQDGFPLFVDHQDQPIVLIHTGYPWVVEAGYVASVLPNVYLELSELVPWGWSQIDWALEALAGTVPAAKVLYGSDEASEPEMFWVSARLVREALQRVLTSFVERDYVTVEQAERIGRDILAGNTRRLHGI